MVLTNHCGSDESNGEHWRVRYISWSEERWSRPRHKLALIVPARPPLGRLGISNPPGGSVACSPLGCPQFGDARSPDVVAFSEACGLPNRECQRGNG